MEHKVTHNKTSKWKKIILTSISVILLILVAFPLVLNLYLKSKLPDLINEKTPYEVELKNFSFDLISGNLHIQDVDIKNKNPKDTSVTQISGKIGELLVQDFGVFKAVFSKSYKAEIISFKNANLNIRLGKNGNENNKKRTKPDVFVHHLKVENAEIKAINYDGKTVFNANKINVDLEDIDLNNSDNSRLPIGFKKVAIKAENSVIMINDYYQILADKIDTQNKEIEILNFHLNPIKNPNEYQSKNIFDFRVKRFAAKDFNINRDSLIAESATFDEPNIVITSLNKKTVKNPPKELNIKIALHEIILNKGKFLVQNNSKIKSASAEEFNVNLSKIILDKNTVKEKIPFKFDSHKIAISQLFVRANNHQEIFVGKVFTDNSDLKLDSVKLAVAGKTANQNLWSGTIRQVFFNKINTKFDGEKIKFKLNNLLVDDANLAMISKLNTSVKNEKKLTSNLGIEIGNIKLNNAGFRHILSDGQPKYSISKINGTFDHFEFDEKTAKNRIPFSIKKYFINADEIFIDAGKYYTLRIKNIQNDGKLSTINQLTLKSKYSRKAFSRIIKKQEDLYDIFAQKIQIFNRHSLLENHHEILLDKVVLDGVKCSIYRDLLPPEDTSLRSMFSEKLRHIKPPLFANLVEIKNSYISYEEDAVNSNIPGKLFLDHFNANIKNVGNGKVKSAPSLVTIDSNFKFFGTAPTKVFWTFDVLNLMDEFKINGKIKGLSANEVNLFVRPYLNITLDGEINYLHFDYFGNKNIIKGNFFLNHHEVYVNFLNKKGEKKKFLNKAVNVFVRSNAKDGGKTVKITKERDPERSFFNILWKGLMEGLKKTLL